jgi:hypothetical protein
MILRLTQELEVESAGAIDCAHETGTKLLKSDTTIVESTTAVYEAPEHLKGKNRSLPFLMTPMALCRTYIAGPECHEMNSMPRCVLVRVVDGHTGMRLFNPNQCIGIG